MIKSGSWNIVFALFLFCLGHAQRKEGALLLQLRHKFGTQPLQQHQTYFSRNDTLEIATFKYYITDIAIEYSDKVVVRPAKQHHLIDTENPDSFVIPIAARQHKVISKVSFKIGVDSTASVSGALSGDLDPAKGMYWAWQSGYINMKVEGKSNSCKTRKNEFHFHLGGYLKPNNALRTVTLPCDKPADKIIVEIDLKPFFDAIELSNTHDIMIPGKDAMTLSDLIPGMFSIE